MIKKLVYALTVAFLMFACTEEEINPELLDNQLSEVDQLHPDQNPPTGGDGNDGGGSSPGDQVIIQTFVIHNCPWAPPQAAPHHTGNTIEVYYNPDFVEEEDINCIRQEYFETYCYLRMAQLQFADPYHDTWLLVDNLPELECSQNPDREDDGTGGTTNPTDTAETTARTDVRTCVGQRCRPSN